jgi:isopropylmalate/homocitrate/citramalate synthase
MTDQKELNTPSRGSSERAPNFVTVKEVGPRDGLQNESQKVSTEFKVQMISQLAASGLEHIEVGAFVSPKWVPQMADSDAVFQQLKSVSPGHYSALVPNETGLRRALAAGASEIAIFAAASESFSQRNINCSIAESFERFKPVARLARSHNLPIRGYLSCVLGCPYEGMITPQAVAKYSEQLMDLGCYEVSLGDTIGIGTPANTIAMYEAVTKVVSPAQTALHFHDTYGRALANIWVCLERGARTLDSAIAGLGGCPYARGASGNVATENVVDLLHKSDFQTGIDLNKLLNVAHFVYQTLPDKMPSAVYCAYRK